MFLARKELARKMPPSPAQVIDYQRLTNILKKSLTRTQTSCILITVERGIAR